METEEGISTRFQTINSSRPLSSRVEVGLYRICQEALTNVARHAKAGRVTVRLVATPEQVRLAVEDDGRGFDTSEVAGGHHGLVGMNERAKMLGGSFDVQSSPGTGTRVQVTVPLERL